MRTTGFEAAASARSTLARAFCAMIRARFRLGASLRRTGNDLSRPAGIHRKVSASGHRFLLTQALPRRTAWATPAACSVAPAVGQLQVCPLNA